MLPTIAELFDLRGKVALVTGGGMGIGKAIAFRLAEAGAAVMIMDIDMQAARNTVEELEVSGRRAAATLGDVSDIQGARKIITSTIEKFGSLNILVNNAAAFPVSPSLTLDEKEWDEVIDTNLKSVFFYSQEVAKEMITSGLSGRIINIGSIHSFKPAKYNIHYCTSKSGLIMLTMNLALELAENNITVNAIAPGWIQTPGADKSSKEAVTKLGQNTEKVQSDIENFKQRVPLGYLGVPDDVGKAALFLASNAASYITGIVITVDGGYLLT